MQKASEELSKLKLQMADMEKQEETFRAKEEELVQKEKVQYLHYIRCYNR